MGPTKDILSRTFLHIKPSIAPFRSPSSFILVFFLVCLFSYIYLQWAIRNQTPLSFALDRNLSLELAMKENGRKQGAVSPCAACKLLRRRCAQDCVFAPYFPADEPHKFASVHKVFGASNVNKMLQVLFSFSDSFPFFLFPLLYAYIITRVQFFTYHIQY